MFLGQPIFSPCTPSGIIKLLKRYGVVLSGTNVVVIGRSNIVGKPLAVMLITEGATVTVCHSQTKNLKEFTQKADILISAVGKIGLITKDMVKTNAVVVDVGINRAPNGKLCGDVAFEEVATIASAITPVPGGVGPMTIACLMENTVKATVLQNTL
jgi:methylenetetrahydrofolate dehydrogenase (NADP+)/methenyltetrahydrofolate cyclohydrolase